MKFDQAYYEAIWGSVHRHDYYANDRARFLVERYGAGRILDIGTGCGFLVKTLREMGCDAWGTEISDYALANTCAPGFVVYGDIRDLPFKDGLFDVVHTNGTWPYIPEADVPAAVKEVYRVGRLQEHNIDYLGATVGEEDFATARPREWWDRMLAPPHILVACPMHERKEYSFQEWIDCVKALDYPWFDVLVVENSPGMDFYHRYGDQIPMIHQEDTSTRGWLESMNQCVATIQQEFLKGNYSHWLSCASDVIFPPETLKLMLEYSHGVDWLAHAFPMKEGDPEVEFQSGISLSLLSRRLLEAYDFREAEADAYDFALWHFVRPRARKYKTLEMWGFAKVRHLAE